MTETTGARPHLLALLRERLAAAGDEERGALWRLAEDGRELDANLVRLAPGAVVGEHRESVLDVLLVVVAGSGRVEPEGLALEESAVLWLPRGSHRSFTAGPHGLAYLTVHRRRPGLTVGSAPPGTVRAAEPAAWGAALLHGPGLPRLRPRLRGPGPRLLLAMRRGVPVNRRPDGVGVAA